MLLLTGVLIASAFAIYGATRRRRLEREVIQLRASSRVCWPAMLRNRQAFAEDLEIEVLRASRTGRPTSLVVVSFGEEAWRKEAAQTEISRAIRDAVRGVDVAYSIGAGEIALILPETRARGALVAARRVEDKLLSAGVPPRTVTAGISELGPGLDRHQLFRNAYCALLAAGRDGRFRILTYSPQLEPLSIAGGIESLDEIQTVDDPAA